FLQRRPSYTVLPTPTPADVTSEYDFYFTDSPTQESLAVVDACLHGGYDVPRAKLIFDRLRVQKRGDASLDSRLYDAMLNAYLLRAEVEENARETWVSDFWHLFDVLESGEEKVQPTQRTYAL
ncbi:hypothetical protein SISSUDRAFT_955439, partial [Sistotremastrum suecicum HHB10207 ss-3]